MWGALRFFITGTPFAARGAHDSIEKVYSIMQRFFYAPNL